MNLDLRWIIILFANALLIFAAGELNHHLAALSLHAFLGGLMITFAALRLQIKPAFLANGFTALLFDATAPLPPGVMFLLLMAVHCVIFATRGNVARETPHTATGVAMAANVALMLAVSLAFFTRGATDVAGYWQRALVDIAVSQGIILVAAPWFFSVQLASLRLVGINLDAEQREAQ